MRKSVFVLFVRWIIDRELLEWMKWKLGKMLENQVSTLTVANFSSRKFQSSVEAILKRNLTNAYTHSSNSIENNKRSDKRKKNY